MQSEGKLQLLRAGTALGAILILALALRLWCAGYSPWFDEWMSAWFAGRPLSDLWSTWMVRETNPPLYYSLLKLWTLLFGPRVEAMRWLSVLAGVASVAMLAACAHVAAGRRAALIAGLLSAISAQQVFYSTQARAYIFAELAFALSLLGLLLLFRPDRTGRQQVTAAAIYALGAAVAIHFHTTLVLWPISATAAALVMLAMRRFTPMQLGYLLLADLAAAALASWWLYVTALQIASGTSTIAWIQDIAFRDYLSLLRQSVFLAMTNVWPYKIVSFLLAALAIGAMAGKHRKVALFVGLLLVSSSLVYFVANQFKPIIVSRTLFWMNGLTVLLASATLAELRPAWLRALAVACTTGLLIADLAQARSTFLTEDWQAYIRFQAGDPHATVLVDGPANALVARQACSTELRRACPLHFAVIAAGTPPPIGGRIYLLDTAGGAASSRFALPPGMPLRKFANLKLRGPIAADQIEAK